MNAYQPKHASQTENLDRAIRDLAREILAASDATPRLLDGIAAASIDAVLTDCACHTVNSLMLAATAKRAQCYLAAELLERASALATEERMDAARAAVVAADEIFRMELP